MTSNVELMNLYWTTAGIFPGVAEISRFEFKDCVAKASSISRVLSGVQIAWATPAPGQLRFSRKS
jgi:hypothetical protein